MKETPPKAGDGPSLNGHAILSVADVQSWFKAAKCDVSEERARPIAQLLNEYEFLGGLWKNRPDLRKARRNNPDRLRNVRVAKALQTLQADLAGILETVRRDIPDRLPQYEPVAALLSQVNSIAPYFRQFLPRRGRDADPWHTVAKKVGAKIVEAFKVSGKANVGLGKPTRVQTH